MCKTKDYPQEDMFFLWEEVLWDSDSSWREPTESGAIGKEPVHETLETQVRSLGREDCLEEEMATHSSILAWRIPWTEEPGGLQSMGSRERNMTKAT